MLGLSLILAIVIPLAAAFSPRRLWLPALAWSVMPIGLILLDDHTHSSPADDSAGSAIGLAMFFLWLLLLAVIVVLRGAVEAFRSTTEPLPLDHGQQLAAVVPFAILLAVFFMHWLSNRLAGAQPAGLVHLLVAGGGVLLMLVGKSTRIERFIPRRPLRLFAFTAGATVTLLILSFVVRAHLWAQAAREFAGGASYCTLNAHGYKWRPAESWLELSPLVMRDRGRFGIDTHYWLIVRRPEGLRGYEWYWKDDGFFMEQKLHPEAMCVPR